MLLVESISLSRRLYRITCSTEPGKITHLLGANGAGKSSLLHTIAGLQPADDGRVLFKQVSLLELPASVFANFRCLQLQRESLAFDISVSESIDFIRGQSRLPEMLVTAMEISTLMERRLMTLSGGESQRVEVTRCLTRIWPTIIAGEALILLDEPFKGMDFRHQHLLLELLQQLSDLGNHIIVSHHDLNLCQQYADQVWLLKQGRLLKQGNKEDVLTQNWLNQAFDCKIEFAIGSNGNKIFQTYL